MINSIIVDDEPNCIKALIHDIAQFCPDIHILATCGSAKEAIAAIGKYKPDLVFLDIEMPVMNGFEMLAAIGDINLQIIFTTAYDHFAVKAFRTNAIDYLLKPIDSTDLTEAVAKVKTRLQHKEVDSIHDFLQKVKSFNTQQKIALPTRDGYELVLPEQIIYCKADGAYTHVIMENAKKFILSKSLGEAEHLMPAEFFERVHHSILVNVQHIVQFKKSDGNLIIMDNGDELSVSKSRREHLLLKLGIKKYS